MDVFVFNLGVPAEAKGKIVVHCLVVQEIFLDHIAAVTKAEHKIGETIVRVQLHDMPQDRTTADFHHGLGPILGFFAQASPEPSAQHHDFHETLLAGAGFPKLESGQTAQG
jgi:hypothetical protein